MVCCAPAIINSQPSEEDSQEKIYKKMDEKAAAAGDEDLKLKRLAGGNIVGFPPLFSPNGEFIFVILRNKVQVYSTTTGELVRNLEGAKDNIVGLQYNLTNNKFLVACTNTGEVITWRWKSGYVERKSEIPLSGKSHIESFHLVDIPSIHAALITYRSHLPALQWTIVDISSKRQVNYPARFDLNESSGHVAVDNRNFHYFVIAQRHKMVIVNYRDWNIKRCTNANKVPITCIQTHPVEEMVVTGDNNGRIFTWREFWHNKQYPITTLYHWHHTPVFSIAFTSVGTNFYSGGHEAVLVRWKLDNPCKRFFTPRMSAELLHISTSPDNNIIAVCTADNGINILGAQSTAVCAIQNLTNVCNDKTGLDKFPVGLQLNPQKNCLVFNGGIGYLQFFSTYTKSLLYNMDIVMQNRISLETEKILYDIRVTRAAFNVDWMVTGEVWDDQEHSCEVRLKFWKYEKDLQTYGLNTNVEMAHEGGFQAIEFSSVHETDNLMCATLGRDNVIKVWALEHSGNVNKKGKVWFCVGSTNYKHMPIESIKFCQDGSLLAAGFGNNLCIYKSESLKLKTVLTPPPGYDGGIQKVKICFPKDMKQCKSSNNGDLNGKRKKILQLFKEAFENNGDELVKYIKKDSTRIKRTKTNLPNLNAQQEEMLFRKIQSINELNLFQKLTLYQKLEIFCSVPEESKEKILRYINSTFNSTKNAENHLVQTVSNICSRHRFKAKYRLHNYISRKTHYSNQINEKLVPLLDLLNLNETNKSKSEDKIHNESNSRFNGSLESNGTREEEIKILPPLQTVSSIKSVHFGTGEFLHIVVVCTEHRVLIWNLLTLKLQSVLKLSVHKMVVDPLTSLFAAFAKNNELYIFLPNTPMIIYQRTDLPPIHGACWVPRRYPKSQSITIDWQSMSTLYFLTDSQEILFLAADNDVELSATAAPSFMNEAQETTKYSTFGAFAMKQITTKTKYNSNSATAFTIGVPGKTAARRLTEMSTHAMAPVSLLCKNFIKSLTKVEGEEKSSTTSVQNDHVIVVNDEDKESDDELMEIRRRRKANKFFDTTEMQANTDISSYLRQEQQLRKTLKEKVNLSF